LNTHYLPESQSRRYCGGCWCKHWIFYPSRSPLFWKSNCCHNVGGNPECVIDGKNGFLAEPEIKEIKEKLQGLITNSKLRELMGKKSKEIFEENFSSNQIIKKVIRVYDSTSNLGFKH